MAGETDDDKKDMPTWALILIAIVIPLILICGYLLYRNSSSSASSEYYRSLDTKVKTGVDAMKASVKG
tara:strand:- start:374 stop:577 length:204 start_codon:yes stop_codon:yes gene_type:complete